jgi:tellurite resistance protein
VSAGLFGVVLGIAGLGGAWRLAARAWGLFPAVGECLFGLAALIWAVLVSLYALKWIFDRRLAQAEAAHPVSGCFISLVGVTTMLISLGALPYSRALAEPLFWMGASFTFLFALWRIGLLWQGGGRRQPSRRCSICPPWRAVMSRRSPPRLSVIPAWRVAPLARHY